VKQRGKVLKEYYSTARGGGRRLRARNTRSSTDSSTGIFTNHAARTRRSVGRHVTRVNSTNVLDEGLRIGEIGRQMNSKVRLVKIGVYRK
jgi:hypothetical protein